MRKIIASLVIGLFVAAPLGIAESVSNSADASANSKSAFGLKVQKIKQDVSDFAFGVRKKLTFNKEAKLDLLNERNEKLRDRQKSWLEYKKQAQEEFKSGNLSAEEKQELRANVKDQHQDIVENHLELTAEIKEMKAEARKEKNKGLEKRAEKAAKAAERSKVSRGLNVPGLGLGLGLKDSDREKEESEEDEFFSIESESEAIARVRSELGLEGNETRVIRRNDRETYVVTGNHTKDNEEYVATKHFKALVDADTGIIVSANVETTLNSTINLEKRVNESSDEDDGNNASANVSANAEADTGVGNAELRGNAAVGIES